MPTWKTQVTCFVYHGQHGKNLLCQKVSHVLKTKGEAFLHIITKEIFSLKLLLMLFTTSFSVFLKFLYSMQISLNLIPHLQARNSNRRKCMLRLPRCSLKKNHKSCCLPILSPFSFDSWKILVCALQDVEA